MKQKGVFDEDNRLAALSKMVDPLERLNKYINWEQFKEILTKVFHKEAKGIGGSPPYYYVMMWKILILQKIYNISDAQTEYQVKTA